MELSINVHDLSDMFNGCRSLLEFKEYNDYDWNNKQNNNDDYFFKNEENKDYFKDQDIYHYDENEVSLIKNQNHYSTYSIYGNDVDNSTIKNIVDNIKLNENKYTKMNRMFSFCKSLTSIPDISK